MFNSSLLRARTRFGTSAFLYACVLGFTLTVTACGGGGSSGGGSAPTTPSALSAPTIESVVKKANYKADVNWSTVSGASTYTVYLAIEPFTGKAVSEYASLAGYKKLENLTGNTTEVTLDGNSVYHLIVTASNVAQTSASSAEKTASFTALALNDTDITKCGDYAFDNTASTKPHNNNRDCAKTKDADGDPIPAGQDGHYATGYKNASGEAQKGKKFTKVAGFEGKCVQDEHTGLMWEVKQTGGGLHGASKRYTWYNPDNKTNGGDAGPQYTSLCTASSGNPCNTQAFVEAVNQAGWCGFKDWRLPTVEELRTIVNYGKFDPVIDADYFPNTSKRFYWSSSASSESSTLAWGVRFSRGSDGSSNKYYTYRARLVRAR